MKLPDFLPNLQDLTSADLALLRDVLSDAISLRSKQRDLVFEELVRRYIEANALPALPTEN